jgi:hypothetical protein
MQNVFFHEVEAAYMRRRVQDAVLANGLAAQATAPRTPLLRRLGANLNLAWRQIGDMLQRPWPVLQTLPDGKDLPAVQG